MPKVPYRIGRPGTSSVVVWELFLNNTKVYKRYCRECKNTVIVCSCLKYKKRDLSLMKNLLKKNGHQCHMSATIDSAGKGYLYCEPCTEGKRNHLINTTKEKTDSDHYYYQRECSSCTLKTFECSHCDVIRKDKRNILLHIKNTHKNDSIKATNDLGVTNDLTSHNCDILESPDKESSMDEGIDDSENGIIGEPNESVIQKSKALALQGEDETMSTDDLSHEQYTDNEDTNMFDASTDMAEEVYTNTENHNETFSTMESTKYPFENMEHRKNANEVCNEHFGNMDSTKNPFEEMLDRLERLSIDKHMNNVEEWGNSRSVQYFQDELFPTARDIGVIKPGRGVCNLVSRSLKFDDISSSNADYHLLGTQLFAGLPKSKVIQTVHFINATIDRMKETNFRAETPATMHSEVRRHYTEGVNSIFKSLPAPKVINGGFALDDFAIVPIGQMINHLMAHGYPLKTLRLDDYSDWFDDKGNYHSSFLKSVYEDLQLQDTPLDLRIHLMFIWSDGFQKNATVQTKETSMQLFTVYIVPPDNERDIEKYTIPYALGVKQKEHQKVLISLLKETSHLEKIHKRYCPVEKRLVDCVFIRVVYQADLPERCNNAMIMQNGAFSKRWGHSCKLEQNTPSCEDCYKRRLNECINQNNDDEELDQGDCTKCGDWWHKYEKNENAWFDKPNYYPSEEKTDSSASAPQPPETRRCLLNQEKLPPCRITFDFLCKAMMFAKHNHLLQWTQNETKDYLRTCCFHGALIDSLLDGVAKVKAGLLDKDDIILPRLWHLAETLHFDIDQLPDTPMHLLFLGVMKHMLKGVERLFTDKKMYRHMCENWSSHLSACHSLAVVWCRTFGFSSGETISSVGWQSDQFLAFARLSLVYFGQLEDYIDEFDKAGIRTFRQTTVCWYLVLQSLFMDGKCDTDMVDRYVKLFLSSCLSFGEHTIKEVKKKPKGKTKSRNKANFFEDTSNYFCLLNLKDLIDKHGSVKELWEGEREKYIKYVKKQMHSMTNHDNYLVSVLQKLLRFNCLDQLMENNQYHHAKLYERTSEFKIYSSEAEFTAEFDTGKMLVAVIIKEDIFVCHDNKNISGGLKLHRVIFNDNIGKMKLNLWYSGIYFNSDVSNTMEIDNRAALKKVANDYAIIHPMVTMENQFSKQNGHVVIGRSWRTRRKNGKLEYMSIDKDLFDYV